MKIAINVANVFLLALAAAILLMLADGESPWFLIEAYRTVTVIKSALVMIKEARWG